MKPSTMKYNIYKGLLAVVSVVTLLFAACSKKLDEYNPSGFTASSVYTTPQGFETLVNAAYTYNRSWYGKEEGYSYSEMGTDIWTSGTGDANPQFAQYLNLQGSNVTGGASTSTWANNWNQLYLAVNLCNTGIAGVGNVDGYTVQQKATREAELRFLRAFYYWHIVETWGGVHFTTQPAVGVNTEPNRTPVDTFYKQIFADLSFAVSNLPATTTDYGRATIPVAKAFLARMYLTRGLNNQAAALAKDVIKNYGYTLQPKFADLWSMGNLKNKEVIWALDYSANLSYNDAIYYSNSAGVPQRGSNNGHLLFLMVYDQVNNSILFRDINNGRPFNRFMPTLALLNMFDAANDSRYEGSFQTTWYVNKAGSANGNTFIVGDTFAYCAKTTLTAAEMNSRKYNTYDVSKTYASNGAPTQRRFYVSLKKFKDSTRGTIAEVQSARDVFMIRLAEMYLVAAEAEFNNGRLDSAASYLNVLRKRAAIPGHEAAMQITAGQVTLDFILDERARELCGEQLRWFDLKRTGKLITRIQAMNPDAAVNIKSFHTVRPIPQSQLDAVTNKGVFTQNPGYQ